MVEYHGVSFLGISGLAGGWTANAYNSDTRSQVASPYVQSISPASSENEAQLGVKEKGLAMTEKGVAVTVKS